MRRRDSFVARLCITACVYVGAHDNNLYALNAKDGSFRWKYPTERTIVSSPAVADAENLVVFGSLDQLLYAVDTRMGQLAWTVPTQGPVRSSPSVAHGHVFFGSDDGNLYAVRLATGRVQWQWAGGDPIRSRPLVTGEVIVVGQGVGVCDRATTWPGRYSGGSKPSAPYLVVAD